MIDGVGSIYERNQTARAITNLVQTFLKSAPKTLIVDGIKDHLISNYVEKIAIAVKKMKNK